VYEGSGLKRIVSGFTAQIEPGERPELTIEFGKLRIE
jgi:hypothetical protein